MLQNILSIEVYVHLATSKLQMVTIVPIVSNYIIEKNAHIIGILLRIIYSSTN